MSTTAPEFLGKLCCEERGNCRLSNVSICWNSSVEEKTEDAKCSHKPNIHTDRHDRKNASSTLDNRMVLKTNQPEKHKEPMLLIVRLRIDSTTQDHYENSSKLPS
jgi:hypothetical protein